ncbi:branched-chain amino acid ABC transporter permease [Oricola thermophila]|uniref:Branched-chain amino acid ABC transporter permease n=1 Tax=Oricola thermophila TaxID=2742145 RepID=A0A6N1VJA8_9HYPH|nr:branched-chain amino acid ABC transporter permease [Oricola thermophila]QKV19309.1 branched-chain amino acid ABC transporter permease [Oricola thermophila]
MTTIETDTTGADAATTPAPTAIVQKKQSPWRAPAAFLVMGLLLAIVGAAQSWSVALGILNMSLISALMAMGLNLQWGYAGLFNAGVMAFTALGGLAAVVVSHPPVWEALAAGGRSMALSGVILVATIATIAFAVSTLKGRMRKFAVVAIVVVGYVLLRPVFADAVSSIETVDPARTGFIGGLGLPIVVAWPVGGLFAAAVAWLIGKVALGLRSDYLAIATLGISEIVIAVLKNEDWLARGVKNVTGLPRPVPYEIELQQTPWFIDLVTRFNAGALEAAADAAEREAILRQLVIENAGNFVKLAYAGLFTVVLLIILALCVRALNSPWGRMMRAIRDNDEAAAAMGKDIKARHLQVFVLGSAIIGIAGAMMTTLDGQFTPGTYNPLRFTFLIWVMVIVGGSGNNLGAVLGGFLIWFIWVEAEPAGSWIVQMLSANMDPQSELYRHLQDIAAPFRLFVMGLVLLIVLRFSPRGLLPEKVRHS